MFCGTICSPRNKCPRGGFALSPRDGLIVEGSWHFWAPTKCFGHFNYSFPWPRRLNGLFKTTELGMIRTRLEPRTTVFQSLSSASALPQGKFLPNTPVWIVGMVFFLGVHGQAIDAEGPPPSTLPQECRAEPVDMRRVQERAPLWREEKKKVGLSQRLRTPRKHELWRHLSSDHSQRASEEQASIRSKLNTSSS